jgi:hypothetical protein
MKDGFQLVVESESSTRLFARLGVRISGIRTSGSCLELRLEVSFFHGADSGGEYSLHVDCSHQPGGVDPGGHRGGQGRKQRVPGGIRDGILAAVTIAYSVRAAGYTRQAPFDLAFSIAWRRIGIVCRAPRVRWIRRLGSRPTWRRRRDLAAGYDRPAAACGVFDSRQRDRRLLGGLDLAATIRIDLTRTCLSTQLPIPDREASGLLRGGRLSSSGSRGDFSTSFSGRSSAWISASGPGLGRLSVGSRPFNEQRPSRGRAPPCKGLLFHCWRNHVPTDPGASGWLSAAELILSQVGRILRCEDSEVLLLRASMSRSISAGQPGAPSGLPRSRRLRNTSTT